MSAAGIVLCGGKSSRMRRPKALLPWRGRPMVAHVAAVLREVTDEVVVVSSAELEPELPPLDARIAIDREPGLGPLAGIREGLAQVRAELAYVTSTDAPWLSPAFVRVLLEFGKAAAPEIDGHVQVLAAVYPRALAEAADALLRAGRMRPLFLLEAAGFRRVGAAELPELDSLRSFNTPQEYLAAVRADDPGARATLELLGQARRLAGRAQLEVPVGTLGEVLAHAEPGIGAYSEGTLSRRYLFSLDGRRFVRDPELPIGAGEHVIVMDAAAGG
jgi:molybdopterin-guanine dinucleotide biosynthesis protein A